MVRGVFVEGQGEGPLHECLSGTVGEPEDEQQSRGGFTHRQHPHRGAHKHKHREDEEKSTVGRVKERLRISD